MIVEEVMVKKVITIKSGDTLDTAQSLMVENSIRHLPVADGSELVGILTESDIRSAFLSEIHSKSNSAPPLASFERVILPLTFRITRPLGCSKAASGAAPRVIVRATRATNFPRLYPKDILLTDITPNAPRKTCSLPCRRRPKRKAN